MYLKGKIKIGLKNEVRNGSECYELINYVNELNNKFQNKKNDFATIFYLKNDGDYKNYSTEKESFEKIVNEVLNDDITPSPINKDIKFRFVFRIDYYAKTVDEKMSENDVKNKIEELLKSVKANLTKNNPITILKHITSVEKSIDTFDALVHNKPSELLKFYKGLLNEQDISILSDTYATCKITKREISQTKFNEDAIINKFSFICKDEKTSNEIHRIFSVKDNKNIQGVNYLFKEDDYDIRQNTYKALATALYSKGRLDNPHYYVVNINVNDKNTKSNIIYLTMRLKISRNDLYFFEFTDKDINYDTFFSNNTNFNCEESKFFKALKENQFINTFGIYADDRARNVCSDLEEKELIDKLSFVVFTDKLNKAAQMIYVENQLKKYDQIDLLPVIKEIIEYQSTQVSGLSTKELDDYILSVFKSKYEKVYRPVYEHITKDMTNGNMTARLMNMVGCKNLKQAVMELCNKTNFKNIKEELIPTTKILNEMSNYERNNWILTGEPGTGKSTGAEILEKVMYQEKIIKKDVIVKYTPSNNNPDFIVTPFGPMAIKTSNDLQESFQESIGGVLIVDEIGHLSDEDKSLLLQLMEDYKREVSVILCGYEYEAKALLYYNPGFRSRFTHIIKMDDYTVDELLEILTRKLNEKHFTLSDEVNKMLKDEIINIKQVPNFGQARFMESMADKLVSIHSNSKLKQIEEVLKTNPDAEFNEKDIYEITKEDVKQIPLDDMLGEEWKLIKNHKDAYSELHNLIGCLQVKNEVEEFVAKSKIDKIKVERKLIDKSLFNMNMVFYGSPGTAKTTVARLIARIMYDKGIIKEPKFTEVGAADLVGAYVGHTAIKTTDVFERAKGGVLFIDEAYTLANEKAGGFNQEAIDTIIKEMENNRENTMVIFAGYKNKMEEFIDCNPGFKSRISKYVDFPNYTTEELIQIFEKLCKDNKYTLDENDKDKIIDLIKDYLEEVKDKKQFGNGRECRTILESAINSQSIRLVKFDEISDEELMKLKYEDFKFLKESSTFGVENKNSIGFAA